MMDNICRAILGLFVMGSLATQAQILKPFPNQPQFSFDPTQDVPDPMTCGEAVERLERFQSLNREAHYGLIEFMSESSIRVGEWHGVLQPLEGSPTSIELGTFDVLENGASSMNELTGLAYENVDYLDRELDAIRMGLENCISKK